ncbi:hypothetical protein [Janibacter indicus]|uniref:hypothetical protein n=1 Tax=Janibacter indicus TaxID=857417 RepID=UPI0013562FF3|nr:hypothetical protein [Janibacter indicus]
MDPSQAGNYNRNYLDEDVSPTGEHNVVIDLTHGDISQMKTQAAQAQAAMINADPDAYPHFPGAGEREITSSDVLRHVATTEDAWIELNGMDTATQQILLADSDLEVVKTMMSTGGAAGVPAGAGGGLLPLEGRAHHARRRGEESALRLTGRGLRRRPPAGRQPARSR